MQRVGCHLGQAVRGGDVVHEAADGHHVAALVDDLPPAEQLHDEVGTVALVEQLRDEVEVGDQRALQDDGHVGGVEELDGVRALLAAGALVAHWQVHAEALEVDDDQEDDDGGHEVGDVGHVGAVEGLLEGAQLVAAGQQQVEEGDQGALKLGTTGRVDCVGAERLPDDALADVGGDEERNAGAEPVALLQQLIQADDDDAGEDELHDDEHRVERAEVLDVAIHAGHDVGHSLADGDEDAQELLRTVEQLAIGLDAVVNIDDLGPGQQLHDQSRCHDGADAQLHTGAAVGCHDDTGPIEGI